MEQRKVISVIKRRIGIAIAAIVMAACQTWLAYNNKGIAISEVPLRKLAIRFGLSFVVVAVPILSVYAYAAFVHYCKRHKDKHNTGDKY
jgi:hypothetical protein